MQPNSNHNKNWAAADFERYYSGKMDKAEMYALENDALNDPFLQDAFEGYQYTKTAKEDVEELKSRLEKQNKSKLIPLAWYRQKKAKDFLKVAATILLLVSVSWLLYNNKEETATQPSTELAQVKATNTNVQAGENNAPAALNDSTLTHPEKTAEVTKSEISATRQKPGKNNADDFAQEGKAESSDNPAEEPATPQMVDEKGDSKQAEQIIQSPMPGLSSDKNYSGAVNNMAKNIIKGNVKDQNGQAVPNAVVYDVVSKKAVQTDGEGRFMLPAKDSTVKIAVNAVGYEPAQQTVNANDRTENSIVLKEPNQALSEVVVTSAPAKIKKSTIGASSVKIRGANSMKGNTEPVYVVNSEIIPAIDFKQISPNAIQSMQVINEKNAAALYGSTAANGAILVTLKNNISLHKPATIEFKNVNAISGKNELMQFAKDSLVALGNKKNISLKFDTDDEGKPVRIAVKISMCSTCDAKAVKMLGLAKWQKIKKGKKAEVNLKF